MNERKYHPGLHWFLVATAAATFVLLGSGGMVTSREAGMSVPDWPNTYGYNMFAFPVSKWIGGIFYEHTHRLLASGIGFLTAILAVWLWRVETRRWMRWLGVAAFVMVVLQGVLGGLRVTLAMDKLGVVHGALAQSFFVLLCALALFTSRWWMQGRFAAVGLKTAALTDRRYRGMRALALATTLLIFLQLVLGATMRHQHAGLAIPDFPLAYGKIWPDTSATAVARYNADRIEVISVRPITATQIVLQMVHRMVAVIILIGVCAVAWRARRSGFSRAGPPEGGTPNSRVLRRLAYLWLTVIGVQIILGAATIWTNKAADVATAHVLVGALALATGALWCVIAFAPTAAVTFDGRPAPQPQTRLLSPAAPAMGAQPAMILNK